MFWKFNLVSTSLIETLLQKESVTLRELMNEDDILQECKGQNKALVDYLIHPEIMTELVNLVITEPAEETEDLQRYKYSNIASELLTSDVPQITEALANDKTLLNKLYSFLETEQRLNPLLASFFSKSIGILISRKPETTFQFLQTKDFTNHVIQHFGTSAIMDLLLRLITCSDDAQLRLDILNWLVQQRIVQRLVSLIDCNSDDERQCNASLAVCDIIRMARERQNQLQETADSDPLLQAFESVEVITELLDHILTHPLKENVLVNGVLVLLTLLEVKKPGYRPNVQQLNTEQSSLYFRPEIQETLSPQDEERIRQGLTRTVTAILPRLPVFHQVLLDPPKKNSMLTTVGTLDPPLGSTRIHLARLVTSFVVANIHNVNVELCKLGIIDILIDLFFQYSWNNFLHTQVDQVIGIILTNSPTEDENGKEVHPLLDHLFIKCCLLGRILDAWEDNDRQEGKPNGHRHGYMGHLTNIANHITHNIEKGINSKLIELKMKELPEPLVERWKVFISGSLTEMNKKNIIIPVAEGRAPNSQLSSEDDSEASAIPHETTLQQAFSDYQMQQMTSNFIDQFGFNDDEFGEQEDNVNTPLEQLTTINFNISAEDDAKRDLFDQICNERIQPLDDSDEDIWEDKEQEIHLGGSGSGGGGESGPNGGIGSTIGARTNCVDSDHSSDSDDETAPQTSRVTTNTSVSVPPTLVDEIKMDVDQSEAGWTANFDGVPMPMDTSNPWDSASQPSAAVASTEGWADFRNFADFSSCASFPRENNSASVPMAMETSEEFKIESAIFTRNSAEMLPKIDNQITATSVTTIHFDPSSPKGSNSCPPSESAIHTAKDIHKSTLVSFQKGIANDDRYLPSHEVAIVDPLAKASTTTENGPCKMKDTRGLQLDDRWQESKVSDTRVILPEGVEKFSNVVETSPNGPV